MKRMLAVFAAIVVVGVLNLGPSFARTKAQESKIILTIQSQSVKAGNPFTVDVQIAVPPTLPFLGWQFDLAFDSKLLKLNDVTVGEFLKQCQGKDTFFHAGKIDNAAGTLTGTAGAVLGLPKGCSGSGVIVRLNFTALGNGTPTYTLSKVALADPIMRPNIQSYLAYQYALTGALRQTLDPALIATEDAYVRLPTSFPSMPTATPVYDDFQSTVAAATATTAARLASYSPTPPPLNGRNERLTLSPHGTTSRSTNCSSSTSTNGPIL